MAIVLGMGIQCPDFRPRKGTDRAGMIARINQPVQHSERTLKVETAGLANDRSSPVRWIVGLLPVYGMGWSALGRTLGRREITVSELRKDCG